MKLNVLNLFILHSMTEELNGQTGFNFYSYFVKFRDKYTADLQSLKKVFQIKWLDLKKNELSKLIKVIITADTFPFRVLLILAITKDMASWFWFLYNSAWNQKQKRKKRKRLLETFKNKKSTKSILIRW